MSKNNNMEIGRINDDRREAAEEEDVDEEKMDKFFALIRNFRDARDRRRNELKQLQIRNNNNNNNNNENLKKRKADQDHHRREEQSRSWVPSFEWEDFNDHRKTLIFSNPNPNPNPINNNHQQQQQQRKNEDQQCDETGLDLKLTL